MCNGGYSLQVDSNRLVPASIIIKYRSILFSVSNGKTSKMIYILKLVLKLLETHQCVIDVFNLSFFQKIFSSFDISSTCELIVVCRYPSESFLLESFSFELIYIEKHIKWIYQTDYVLSIRKETDT